MPRDRERCLSWRNLPLRNKVTRQEALQRVGRAEAQVVRLALIYALLDCAREIRAEHLRAALAIWTYCEASARFIWGDSLGDPTADEILRA